ncbi:FKBP-type peptidyl-prolyl cis-trans isomerase [Paramicrobacterium chengjingii]|uniref:Peptidylprolyl isomerase n=1 Tax=Paramicrobacterium chengjingii TaxID=2769067 RepID=A0ABX6YMK0_9MICO|nr:FKBP-type peptidyl-prolyl cis-trans isomerase [Microbacterium chengjingii]QPZ39910.1 hypothetical protein HCR76_07795 [Microbacterium chengjingii]
MTSKRGTVRYAPAVLLTAALVTATLSGCASTPSGATCLEPGDASNQVSATGKLGSEPNVSIPSPLYAPTTQVSTAIEGDGTELAGTEVVELAWSLYNGRTGEKIFATPYDDLKPASPSGMLLGMADALACHTVGSRLVATITPDKGFGDAGNPMYGVKADDTLVMVIDIENAYLGKSNGINMPVVQPGFPSVAVAPDGTPGLTIPTSPAPTEAKSALLKLGNGEKVTSSDTVLAQIQQASWNNQSITSSTWSDGSPKTIPMKEAPNELKDALKNTPVGSQVIVLVPTPDGDATIYVIDVLGVL